MSGYFRCSRYSFLKVLILVSYFLVAAWKHRFSAQCLSVVHDEAFGARPTTYKAIQELDRKVRNWYVPPSLQVPGFGAAKSVSAEIEQPTVQLTMQRYIAYAIKEMSRSFFSVPALDVN